MRRRPLGPRRVFGPSVDLVIDSGLVVLDLVIDRGLVVLGLVGVAIRRLGLRGRRRLAVLRGYR